MTQSPPTPAPPAGTELPPKASWPKRFKDGWSAMPDGQRRRLTWALVFLAVLTGVFLLPLIELIRYTSGVDLHSHIMLIPVVAVYLMGLRWGALPATYQGSPGWALVPLAGGLAALALAWGWWPTSGPLTQNDRLGLYAAAYVGLLWAGGFAILGARWMWAAAFPLAFLVFLIPMPTGMEHTLETASQYASAEATAWMYELTGLPNIRDGLVFQLPGITIKVAQECSGIRSSWVLFITSLVAAEMFLRSPWRRFILVALVIPLGILRNGFRILVISWLCVEVGPHMIDSIVHHRGGPIFFAVSLVPLFLILWLLRRGEERREE
jgi:exosortase C (VPDSG-CTERM-specific)